MINLLIFTFHIFCCYCLPTPLPLLMGESDLLACGTPGESDLPLVVHQPASLSIWSPGPAVSVHNLTGNSLVRMWGPLKRLSMECVCGGGGLLNCYKVR